ncbi:S41 family peptidase [Paenibacillus albicereus]|uniref:S41 family peptidase n=1 Tax=Paenibacillus albicereus TaxID=2726185 RepID=A0A6H2H213_9BACL|nr:S41 family peptidase [Paenibacillus albicereus]QJC53733.1 S41 family peptidase [Paenibacillus albicereus]
MKRNEHAAAGPRRIKAALSASLAAALLLGGALPAGTASAKPAPAEAARPAHPALGWERTQPAASAGLTKEEEQRLNAVMELIQRQYYEPVDRDKLISGALSGMVEALGDPYSSYMDAKAAKQFSETVEGAFGGVGAEVTSESGKIVIVSPIKGSPAEKAGLQAKDVILSVNGVGLSGLPITEAVAKLRGPKGSSAELVILRAGRANPFGVKLVRAEIDIETVEGKLLADGIGLIEIRQFSLNTADRFAEELDKLEKRKLRGLVIDVRNNPGGILPVVERIAQPFVPKGRPILQIAQRGAKPEQVLSEGGGKPYPVAVLMNKGSASASEILAGALQESAGAVLVGETSFGKGTVQVSYDRHLEGGLVKMTIAKWLTPGGGWIHKRGIKPDVAVRPPALYAATRLAKTGTIPSDAISDDAKSLQVMLKGLGYDPGRLDGYYSSGTAQAVRGFQRASGLKESGQADPATQRKLEEAVQAWVGGDEHDTQLDAAVRALREGKGAPRL